MQVANGAYIGEILGLAVTGILCDRYGNKAVMTGATILMIAFIFISFFGETLPLQLVGQILCGIPWVSAAVHRVLKRWRLTRSV
jgi:MFS transporter, SP family, general alpha glucoside:H+ symporter